MTAGSRFVPVVDDHGESPYCPEPRARRASRAGGGEQAAGTQGALRDELFDCVPLDVLMPELDGYQRGEAIVAYGQAMREEPTVVESCGVVHPGHRGRGIGSWLLDRIQQRASGLLAGVPSPRFRHAVNAGDRPAAAMLQARALRPVRHFWHMQIELAAEFEAGPTPAGIEISGIDPRVHLPSSSKARRCSAGGAACTGSAGTRRDPDSGTPGRFSGASGAGRWPPRRTLGSGPARRRGDPGSGPGTPEGRPPGGANALRPRLGRDPNVGPRHRPAVRPPAVRRPRDQNQRVGGAGDLGGRPPALLCGGRDRD
jgi:GNAT superfamily N-acetyltransferase